MSLMVSAATTSMERIKQECIWICAINARCFVSEMVDRLSNKLGVSIVLKS